MVKKKHTYHTDPKVREKMKLSSEKPHQKLMKESNLQRDKAELFMKKREGRLTQLGKRNWNGIVVVSFIFLITSNNLIKQSKKRC